MYLGQDTTAAPTANLPATVPPSSGFDFTSLMPWLLIGGGGLLLVLALTGKRKKPSSSIKTKNATFTIPL